jgi:hypothetical protein
MAAAGTHLTDLYPSYCEDWQDPRTILSVIVCHHHEIRETTRGVRTHAELRDLGIFFYKDLYVPPTQGQLYGDLEPVPLPNLDDPEWPLPDMSTSEAFRAKIRSDFQRITKVTTGSHMGHLQWFIPMHVLIDFFAVSNNVRRTVTLLKVVQPEEALFDSMMDAGWDEKIVVGRDILKTQIIKSTVQFKYHIGRETLYANFKYQRLRFLNSMTWELLDQSIDEEMVWVSCYHEGALLGKFEVGRT